MTKRTVGFIALVLFVLLILIVGYIEGSSFIEGW